MVVGGMGLLALGFYLGLESAIKTFAEVAQRIGFDEVTKDIVNDLLTKYSEHRCLN